MDAITECDENYTTRGRPDAYKGERKSTGTQETTHGTQVAQIRSHLSRLVVAQVFARTRQEAIRRFTSSPPGVHMFLTKTQIDRVVEILYSVHAVLVDGFTHSVGLNFNSF